LWAYLALYFPPANKTFSGEKNLMMLDWNNYKSELLKTIPEFGKLTLIR
jgi:hypothetical protein